MQGAVENYRVSAHLLENYPLTVDLSWYTRVLRSYSTSVGPQIEFFLYDIPYYVINNKSKLGPRAYL